jgi:hypothetical protein
MTDVENICLHPLEDLLQDKTGFWLCECGAVGTIGTDDIHKLKYTPQTFTMNRSNRRKLVRQIKKWTKIV